jgi:hypothetical protein
MKQIPEQKASNAGSAQYAQRQQSIFDFLKYIPHA